MQSIRSTPNCNSSIKTDALSSLVATGNALPVLHEIKHALAMLLKDGTSTTIDLGAIPFSQGDERNLEKVLGNGEVHATIKTLGESHLRETSIQGVWRVDHLDNDGQIESRFIEVTFLPEILKTHRQDAVLGLETLTSRLKELDERQ